MAMAWRIISRGTSQQVKEADRTKRTTNQELPPPCSVQGPEEEQRWRGTAAAASSLAAHPRHLTFLPSVIAAHVITRIYTVQYTTYCTTYEDHDQGCGLALSYVGFITNHLTLRTINCETSLYTRVVSSNILQGQARPHTR